MSQDDDQRCQSHQATGKGSITWRHAHSPKPQAQPAWLSSPSLLPFTDSSPPSPGLFSVALHRGSGSEPRGTGTCPSKVFTITQKLTTWPLTMFHSEILSFGGGRGKAFLTTINSKCKTMAVVILEAPFGRSAPTFFRKTTNEKYSSSRNQNNEGHFGL